MRKILIALLTPLIITAASTQDRAQMIKQLFNLQTVQIKSVKISKKREYYGYIRAEDEKVVDVVPRFSGFVEKLYADTLYMKIKKGDRLAQIYSPEVYQAKEEYLNALLFDQKRSATQMVKSAKLKLKLLGVSAQEIRDIKRLKRANTLTTIYAPSSGWLFTKSINRGSSFDSKKILFSIVDLSSVWVEARVYQDDIELIDTFDSFSFKVTGIDRAFDATKVLLYPHLKQTDAVAILRLKAKNIDELLKVGMYVKLEASGKIKERILIPRTALMRKNGRWYAFLATDFEGVYEPVIVEAKPLNRDYFEVISGLKATDTVVRGALFMLDSDAQIDGLYGSDFGGGAMKSGSNPHANH